MIAFHFIQSSAFSCLDIRYLHATSNPYPLPRLILFPVNLVSKNYPGRVKTRRYTYILPKEYGPRLCLRTSLQLHYRTAHFRVRMCSYKSLLRQGSRYADRRGILK